MTMMPSQPSLSLFFDFGADVVVVVVVLFFLCVTI